MSRRNWYLFIAAAIVYTLLSFIIPNEAETLEQYHISDLQANLLKLTIVVPLIAIWFTAFYGYSKFISYARTIKSAQEGRALRRVANGLGVLAVSLPVSSIVSTLFEYSIRNNENAIPSTTIISNYINLILAFAAFWLIFRGSQELANLVKDKANQNRYTEVVMTLTGILAVLYTYLIFQNPNRQFPTASVERAVFYLPDSLIMVTIVLPYLFIWFMGLQSAAYIGQYASTVKGILYKQVLNYLVKGMIGIIIASILIQFLVNLAAYFNRLSLTPLLGIIYLLVIVLAIGYIYVAIGAKKLQKIEEV